MGGRTPKDKPVEITSHLPSEIRSVSETVMRLDILVIVKEVRKYLRKTLTSSRPRITAIVDAVMKLALMRFGNAYSQCFIHQTPFRPPKIESDPNKCG